MARKRVKVRAVSRPASGGGVLEGLWSLIAWLTGILVSLAVGFGMTGEILTIPNIPSVITITAGWIVIVLALLGAVLKIIDRAGR